VRVQRMCRRALILMGTASTSQILQWAYCRKHAYGLRLAKWDSRSCRRALDGIAERIGRAATRGRPWLWRLRDTSSA
jgi:hypothetical protein